ncbi:MAG: MFS transporter [Novosphingobium sp.]
MQASNSASREWREYWCVPLAAALGYSTAVLSAYGLGPFVEPIQREFGWSRAIISSGLTIVGLSGAALSIPMGMLVDRVGPRKVALVGAVLMPMAFALLGTATGSQANWLLLWLFVAFANIWMQGTVWVAAVSSRFDKSRGLAIAIAMSGGSLTSAVLPIIATSIMEASDWRTAIASVGGIWFLLVFPAIFLFFRGAQDSGTKLSETALQARPVLTGRSVGEALRMRQFYQLIVASGFYAFAGIGTIVHFIPVLTDRGATPLGAAGVASLIGIFSLIGRLSTGFLLDRFAPHLVGAAAFVLPVAACGMLIVDGQNPVAHITSAIFFGFSLGAEMDVIAYLVSRHFGMRNYGIIFGSITAALAMGTALGPLFAGYFFDVWGSYAQFLMLTAVLMLVSSVAVATLGKVRGEPPIRNAVPCRE